VLLQFLLLTMMLGYSSVIRHGLFFLLIMHIARWMTLWPMLCWLLSYWLPSQRHSRKFAHDVKHLDATWPTLQITLHADMWGYLVCVEIPLPFSLFRYFIIALPFMFSLFVIILEFEVKSYACVRSFSLFTLGHLVN